MTDPKATVESAEAFWVLRCSGSPDDTEEIAAIEADRAEHQRIGYLSATQEVYTLLVNYSTDETLDWLRSKITPAATQEPLCPQCGKPFTSPDFDPHCSSCTESGALLRNPDAQLLRNLLEHAQLPDRRAVMAAVERLEGAATTPLAELRHVAVVRRVCECVKSAGHPELARAILVDEGSLAMRLATPEFDDAPALAGCSSLARLSPRRCAIHGGFGFMSDCLDCKAESDPPAPIAPGAER